MDPYMEMTRHYATVTCARCCQGRCDWRGPPQRGSLDVDDSATQQGERKSQAVDCIIQDLHNSRGLHNVKHIQSDIHLGSSSPAAAASVLHHGVMGLFDPGTGRQAAIWTTCEYLTTTCHKTIIIVMMRLTVLA